MIKQWTVGCLLVFAALAASAQELDPVEMLGGFDQIAEACAPDRSPAVMAAVRIRLMRQVIDGFGGQAKPVSDAEISSSLEETRRRIAADSSGVLTRRYEAGRRGVDHITALAQTKPVDFERICKSSQAVFR